MSDGIDLFSGARGWEARAASSLGLDLLGIEWWEPACKTSEAAGLRTLQADIAELDPADFFECQTCHHPDHHHDEGGFCASCGDRCGDPLECGADLLVGSPPCPTYSNAGNGAGKHDLPHVVACTRELADGRDTRAEHRARCKDERSMLVVEPLRWALALKPRAVVLEQVPSVLPYWKMVGEILAALGYSWWAGLLNSERYGVPQTRTRAILIARNDGVVAHPPVPTHHRFVSGEARPVDEVGMLGTIKSWVSMADALGWADDALVGFPRRNDLDDGGEYRERDLRPSDEPAFNLTEKARSWQRFPAMRNGGQKNQAVRGADDPAPTIIGGHDTANRVWVQDGGKETIRVTVEEAAALQSFPHDWPWQGTRTAQFTQVGNAVPPLLGEAVLRTVLPAERWRPVRPT